MHCKKRNATLNKTIASYRHSLSSFETSQMDRVVRILECENQARIPLAITACHRALE